MFDSAAKLATAYVMLQVCFIPGDRVAPVPPWVGLMDTGGRGLGFARRFMRCYPREFFAMIHRCSGLSDWPTLSSPAVCVAPSGAKDVPAVSVGFGLCR